MRALLLAGLISAFTAFTALAGHETTIDKKEVAPAEEFSPFSKGHFELEIGAGAFGSIVTKGTAKRPDVGYAIGEIRFGLMLSDPMGSGFCRGNIEAMLELFGAGIYTGPGDQIYGASFILRWNFVQPAARIVPFVQIQGGGAYSDMANDDPVQRLIGSDFSFTFGAEIGVRCMIRPNIAITTSFEYRHISNADTAERNVGLNSLGGTLAVNLFY